MKLKNSRLLFYDAVPLDSWMSNSCSATMIQESASREEIELLFFNKDSLGELSMSVVHCTSGAMPTWSISWRAGDRYFATVTNRADPSCNSVTLCRKKYTRRHGGKRWVYKNLLRIDKRWWAGLTKIVKEFYKRHKLKRLQLKLNEYVHLCFCFCSPLFFPL